MAHLRQGRALPIGVIQPGRLVAGPLVVVVMTTVAGPPEGIEILSVNFALRAMPLPSLFHVPLIHGETMIVHVLTMLRAAAGPALVIREGTVLIPGSQFWRTAMGLKTIGDGGSLGPKCAATTAIESSLGLPPGASSPQGKDV